MRIGAAVDRRSAVADLADGTRGAGNAVTDAVGRDAVHRSGADGSNSRPKTLSWAARMC